MAVGSASSDGKAKTRAGRAKCPIRPVPPLYGELDEVVAAARRLMIRGSESGQGQTIKLNRKNSPVFAVVILARTARPIPGAAALRAEATRRCGTETAQASWAVTIGVPAFMADASMRSAFLIKTISGWRTY
ncbi:MAG TPA: hypothetical protein VEL76_12830 [Gemmataceae bacterium]|nr:hypothetical protein [Gemmataceae bacterium]